MASPIELKIDGVSYADFKEAEVTYSMDQLARTFRFSFSDKWLNSALFPLPFVEGDPCTVSIHGTTVVEGFIDDIPISYDATSHSIDIVGRSNTADLVDCSAIYKGGAWKNAKLIDVASVLCKPFGLTAEVEDFALPQSLQPFTKWAIEDEETVFSCIQRAAKMRGLFLISDTGNKLLITKASPVVFPYSLVFGVNVKRGRRTSRFRERYSEYTIKSQTAGDDTFFADAVGKGFFKAEDPQILKYRPLIIVSDGSGKAAELQLRGNWERNVRAGRSRRLSYEHQGFLTKTPPFQLFPINQLIAVTDRYVDFSGLLLIASVSYRYSRSGGETTNLELGAREAYDVLVPPPKRQPKKGGGSLW